MSGVMDFIFGDSEDAQQTGTAPTMTGGQRELLNRLTGILGSQMPVTGKGRSDFDMPQVGRSTSTALNRLLSGSSGRIQDPNATGTEVLNQIMSGYSPESTAEWWEQSVKAPMMEAWQKDILPQVMEPFVAANSFDSGASRRAVAESGRRLTTDMGAMLSDAQQNERLQHLNRIMNVPGMSMSLEQQPFDNLLRTIGLGMTGADWEQNLKNSWMNLLPTALGSSAFSPIVQGPTQSQGLFQSFVSPLLSQWAGTSQGAGAISGMFGG